MKRKTTLGVMLALAATAPAVVVPKLVSAQAQDAAAGATTGITGGGTPSNPNLAPAEYPDVPRGHWAYNALNTLSQAGILEGLPDGTYAGNKPMTRYEFAVAIARLLVKIPNTVGGERGERGETGPVGPAGPQGPQGPAGTGGGPAVDLGPYALKSDLPDFNQFARKSDIPNVSNFITRDAVNDLIAALRREFAQELERLGVRVDALENRVTNLEGRINKPPKTVMSVGVLHRVGTANYIHNESNPNLNENIGGGTLPGVGGVFGPSFPIGRNVLRGNNTTFDRFGTPENLLPVLPSQRVSGSRERVANAKYSYTDIELRLTDRITDRLSGTAALRSQGNTTEDPWAGESGGSAYLREAYVVADLSDRSPLGIRGLTGVLGRQHTKYAQGLLYNNDLSPTDQAHLMFSLGPVRLSGFLGASDGNSATDLPGTFFGSATNPYLTTGAVGNFGLSGVRGTQVGGSAANLSGAVVGFPSAPGGTFSPGGPANFSPATVRPEANESAVRASFDLFRLSGQPVGIGYTRLLAGVQNQKGDAIDLTIPLFNRTVGIEYVRQLRYFNGARTASNDHSGLADRPNAFNVTLPVLRTRFIDLDASYGRADDAFEYFVASSANPFARTYAEALFDRPMALGAPMINGGGNGVARPGEPLYMAAKRVYDIKGTARIPFFFLKRLPIDFRYYRAKGSKSTDVVGAGRVDLGDVYSLGTTFALSPGLDLEVKGGIYDVPGPYRAIRYFRVGANVGF